MARDGARVGGRARESPAHMAVLHTPSSPCQHTLPRWLRTRVISRNKTRMTDARRGTSMLRSFSTASEYPCSDAIIET